MTVDYDGEEITLGTYDADENGEVEFGFYLKAGRATAGPLKITVTGMDSGVSQDITVTVAGEETGGEETGGEETPSDDDAPTLGETPAPVTPAAQSHLPVVAG